MSPETPAEVLQAVADYYGVATDRLRGKERNRPVAWARHMAIWVLRHKLRLGVEEIGRLLNRNHKAACYAINKINDLRRYDDATRSEGDQILRTLWPGAGK